MDVIINGKLYKATEQPIIAILSKKDKENISMMAEGATRYGCFPSEMRRKDMERIIKENTETA